LCPIIWYQLRGALFLANVLGGAPDLNINVLWVQEKGIQICIFFLSQKVPVNEPVERRKDVLYVGQVLFVGNKNIVDIAKVTNDMVL
jgi:ribosome-associated protein YbcJ (S4-like RNA binding protein)